MSGAISFFSVFLLKSVSNLGNKAINFQNKERELETTQIL